MVRGLQWYRVQEVERSSWVRSLCRLNMASGRHDADYYADQRHFIFAFHDITFECLARGYSFVLKPESLWHVALSASVEIAGLEE